MDQSDRFGFALMKYFFENSGLKEIVVRNDPKMPLPLRQLFRSEYDEWSMTAIPTLLPQVTAICITEIDQEDISKNEESYMKCIEQWTQLCKHSVDSRIEFRTKMAVEDRENNDIKTFIANREEMMKNRDWTLKYDFGDDRYHRILCRLNFTVSVKDEVKPQWIWTREPRTPSPESDDNGNDSVSGSECSTTYELSLDAEPAILAQLKSLDDDEKLDENVELEFCRVAVISVIGQDVVERLSLRIIIDGIKRGSLIIVYRVIAADVAIMAEAVKQIESGKGAVDRVLFRSFEFPVNSIVLIDQLSLSEMVLREERSQKRKEEAAQQRRDKMEEAIRAAEQMKAEMEKERQQFEREQEQKRKEFEEKMRIALNEQKAIEHKAILERKEMEKAMQEQMANDKKKSVLQKQIEESFKVQVEALRQELMQQQQEIEQQAADLKQRERELKLKRDAVEAMNEDLKREQQRVQQKSDEIEKKQVLAEMGRQRLSDDVVRLKAEKEFVETRVLEIRTEQVAAQQALQKLNREFDSLTIDLAKQRMRNAKWAPKGMILWKICVVTARAIISLTICVSHLLY